MAKQSSTPRLKRSVKHQRHQKIVELVAEAEDLTLPELVQRLGHVSVVTVRRDVAELSDRGLLVRTRGGATVSRDSSGNPSAESARTPDPLGLGEVDAIILPPVDGTGAATLRSWARRRHISFVAETAPQEGGVYVGHDNFAVGRRLGARAASLLNNRGGDVDLLLVSSEMLANTRSRCDGFLRGFTGIFHGKVRHWRVDGQGIYRQAKRVAREAFAAHPSINVVFGVNDHSVLALLDAAAECGADVSAFSIGGEGAGLFNAMMEDSRLSACAALFPELAGIKAIDTVAEILKGRVPAGPVTLPCAILTRENLTDYYRKTDDDWKLRTDIRNELAPELADPVERARSRRRIGFVPHFPAHDWYRNMIRAMKARCDERGFELQVAPPQAGIAEEINYLRGCIARSAAMKVSAGDAVAINAGALSELMIDYLPEDMPVTIVTNSLDILFRLTGKGRFKVILTPGEYQEADRCMVGPNLGALFETMRIDKAFLSVDGFSPRFGPSTSDEKLALVAQQFCSASRDVYVMADHSLFGMIASHRIVPISDVREVITDRSTLSSDRFELMAAGVRLTFADGDAEGDYPDHITSDPRRNFDEESS